MRPCPPPGEEEEAKVEPKRERTPDISFDDEMMRSEESFTKKRGHHKPSGAVPKAARPEEVTASKLYKRMLSKETRKS